MTHRSLPVRRHPELSGPAQDAVAVEEPLELRVEGTPLVVTMRTPGHDRELAAGWLYSEGLIDGADDLAALAHVRDLQGMVKGAPDNVVDTRLASGARLQTGDLVSAQRSTYASSSCGVCGLTRISELLKRSPPLDRPMQLPPERLCRLPGRMLDHQPTFQATGGLHAAALFDIQGELLVVREDIGRHNAVDKVLGWALLNDAMPLSRHILVVSSRAGFEITQKALMARIPVLVAVGAPSTLAVELARQAGMQLAGFARGGRCNEYSP
ncbi:MAG: formate dehydrogenase accessory sulfurtransferase FdhD [Myxococcota bacterium]|nr:formate dehydrogenase accessory sulfurtransferase FdhD [Myxococcota bacterium]